MKQQAPAMVRDVHTRKHREIVFARFPPGQLPEAASLLGGLPGLTANTHADGRTLLVEYDLLDYTLCGLEEGLADQGFHLDNSLMCKLLRAFTYYIEETQLHNLQAPERLIKTYSKEAYAKAWDSHLHGDHDDTPAEWREYK